MTQTQPKENSWQKQQTAQLQINLENLAALPIATEENLDALATLAMSNLYLHCGDEGGRELKPAHKWLIVLVDGKLTGYTMPEALRIEFQTICEEKWKNLMRVLNK